MLTIEVQTTDYNKQRYDTLGDWQGNEKLRLYSVTEMKHTDFEFLIALHEMIEHALCMKRGITSEMVDEFDMNYEGDDPGSDPLAPYHREHIYATAIECSLLKELGYKPEEYDKFLDDFLDNNKWEKEPKCLTK